MTPTNVTTDRAKEGINETIKKGTTSKEKSKKTILKTKKATNKKPIQVAAMAKAKSKRRWKQ